jgi:hypothetical protein
MMRFWPEQIHHSVIEQFKQKRVWLVSVCNMKLYQVIYILLCKHLNGKQRDYSETQAFTFDFTLIYNTSWHYTIISGIAYHPRQDLAVSCTQGMSTWHWLLMRFPYTLNVNFVHETIKYPLMYGSFALPFCIVATHWTTTDNSPILVLGHSLDYSCVCRVVLEPHWSAGIGLRAGKRNDVQGVSKRFSSEFNGPCSNERGFAEEVPGSHFDDETVELDLLSSTTQFYKSVTLGRGYNRSGTQLYTTPNGYNEYRTLNVTCTRTFISTTGCSTIKETWEHCTTNTTFLTDCCCNCR